MDQTSFGPDELEKRFGYHKPTLVTQPMHIKIRELYADLAKEIDRRIPVGRAKAMAMTELESSLMWSNKAIAETDQVIHENAQGSLLEHQGDPFRTDRGWHPSMDKIKEDNR